MGANDYMSVYSATAQNIQSMGALVGTASDNDDLRRRMYVCYVNIGTQYWVSTPCASNLKGSMKMILY